MVPETSAHVARVRAQVFLWCFARMNGKHTLVSDPAQKRGTSAGLEKRTTFMEVILLQARELR